MRKNLTPLIATLTLAVVSAWGASPQTGSGAKPVSAKPAGVQTIAHGQQVSLIDYLSPGRTTVFDFSSEFCPPCRALAPQLDKLHRAVKDIVVVKVNINRPGARGIDWKSPVAQQYDLHSIPHLKVFGADGKLKAEGKEAQTMVSQWIRQLRP